MVIPTPTLCHGLPDGRDYKLRLSERAVKTRIV
jgi:hypothetical protein